MSHFLRYLRSRKLSHQILLLVGAFAIPTALAALYFVVTGIDQDIDFAIHEKHGNAYQRCLETLFEKIPEHEFLSLTPVAGNKEVASHLAAIDLKIDEAWGELYRVQALYGMELQFTPEGLAKRNRGHVALLTVRKEWDQLRTSVPPLSRSARVVAIEHHRHLMSDIRTLITHAGDTSFLILDPDLDSYYLMDATLQALPQIQDRLALLLRNAEEVSSTFETKIGQVLPISRRIQFAVFRAQLKEADEDRILGDARTSLNEDAGFYGISESLQRRVPPAIADYQAANETLLTVLAHLAESGEVEDLPQLVKAAARTRASSFQLWRVSVDELDRLLDARIQHYVHMRTRGLTITGVALVLSAFLAMFIISDITRSLRRIIATLQKRASPLVGNVRASASNRTAKLKTKDELAILSDAFDEMLSAVELRDEELERHRKNLELQVVERTAELTESNRQLHSAKQRAEESTRLKGEFLANMSHEIRTPMNGVVGMTELALATELTREQREYLAIVKSSANDLLTIINDILDFSRIEAGKLTLHPVQFELRKIINDAIKGLALRAHQRNLELLWHIAPSVPNLITGDPVRLNQIIINLLGNAIKFTDQGEVVLRVETAPSANCTPSSDGSTRLLFSIIDTGVGIPADQQERIFGSFQQVDGSARRHHGGTGLGLAIVSQLVKLMGGEVWMHSEIGQGSTFSFTTSVISADTRVQNELPGIAGLRVLVVEDNATSRDILENLLSSWGMLPTVVDCGEKALTEILQAECTQMPFHRVLLDAQMPGMNGFDLTLRMRKAGHQQLPILMLSGADQSENVRQCQALGVREYLLKPVNPPELLEILLGSGDSLSIVPTLQHGERNTNPLQILVVEDNAVNQRLLERMLDKCGHSVVLAGDGYQALEALKGRSFDVVLMDIQMPGLTGYEVTAEIRAGETGRERHLPIIAVTANAMDGDKECCLLAGMDGYISKPIRFQELNHLLESIARQSLVALS